MPAREAQTFPIASGRNLCTPPGHYHIVSKRLNPGGPFGSRWMGLSVWGPSGKQYGIHGTNQPRLIGGHVSHGCVRMYNGDAENVYAQVESGTPVVIVGEPEAKPTALHIEASPPAAQVTVSAPDGRVWTGAAPFDLFLGDTTELQVRAEAEGYEPLTIVQRVERGCWAQKTLVLQPLPQARRVAFVRDQWLCLLDRGAAEPIAIEIGGSPRWPTFTAEGQSVVVCQGGRLLLADTSSAAVQELPFQGYAVSAAASPVSHSLAVVSATGDGWEMHQVTLEGQVLGTAPLPAEPLDRPQWHPSGQSVTLAIRQGGHARWVSAPLPLTVLTSASEEPGQLMAWSPDGDRLALVCPDDQGDCLTFASANDPAHIPVGRLAPDWTIQAISWGPGAQELTVAMRSPAAPSGLWVVGLLNDAFEPRELVPRGQDPCWLW